MKVVESELVEHVHAYLLTGNGSRDLRIMKALAEKYDHSKVIRTPKSPLPRRKPIGLKPVIIALAHLSEDYPQVNGYVIVIDLEHVSDVEQCRKALREHAFKIEYEEQLGESAWYFKTVRGAKEQHIYIAVSGCREASSIEYHLAQLISLRYNVRVEPNKEEVNRWLRTNDLDDKRLIRLSGIKYLEQVFSPHIKILKKISRDP